MNSTVARVFDEYGALCRILSTQDILALAIATVKVAPTILRTRKLAALDAAMSRDLEVHYRGSVLALPLVAIDSYLAGSGGDNPTFGNVREMYARDCYLNRLRLPAAPGVVLDLGANRGMFSLLALAALGTEVAIGVEPRPAYDTVMQMLMEANNLAPNRATRYHRFITSPSVERQDPDKNISIETIYREHSVDRIGLVKMDIEGYEKDLFSEPEWLGRVDTITMEVHTHLVGDLTLIPEALARHGFQFVSVGQSGAPCAINDAVFVYASRTGALLA